MTRPACITSVVFVLMVLASCSQEVPEPRHGAAVDAIPQERRAAVMAFEVQPDTFKACEANHGAITASVRWAVEDGSPSGVAIYVVDSQGNRKLWLEGGASGESTTGPWVFPGTRFILTERTGGRQLADVVVKGVPCDEAERSPVASAGRPGESASAVTQGLDP